MSTTLQLFVAEFALALSAWTLIAWNWVFPWLKTKTKKEAIMILLAPQMMRFVGISLVIPGVVGSGIPKDLVAQIALLDAATSLFAILGILILRSGWKGAMAIAWLINIFGFADLLISVIQSSLADISPHLHAGWYVPTLAVPATLTSHILSFIILTKNK
jgi:hypothetical protein